MTCTKTEELVLEAMHFPREDPLIPALGGGGGNGDVSLIGLGSSIIHNASPIDYICKDTPLK